VTAGVGLANLVLGTVYTSYGLLTLVDMRRGWRTHGFSHFGAAWVAMAFTCGPHHLDHGIHVLATDRPGGGLDLIAMVVGLPAGVIWFLLRVEALTGGRGDRSVRATPLWLDAMPALGAVYLTAMVAAATGVVRADWVGEPRALPHLPLVVLYTAIGMVLARTQVRNHAITGGWSLSGLTLAMVMLTCSVMHGTYALYGATGRYHLDVHGQAIAWLSVPAAAYFCWVVWALHRGALRDWNEGSDVGGPPSVGRAPDHVLAEAP
jgi:hypothetical protein